MGENQNLGFQGELPLYDYDMGIWTSKSHDFAIQLLLPVFDSGIFCNS